MKIEKFIKNFKVDCVALDCNSVAGIWIDSVSGWSITIILINVQTRSGSHTYEAVIEDQNGSEIARDTFTTDGELNGPTDVVFATAGPATIRLD